MYSHTDKFRKLIGPVAKCHPINSCNSEDWVTHHVLPKMYICASHVSTGLLVQPKVTPLI